MIFFVDIYRLLESDSFIDDYATIALEAPEITEQFIYKSFLHVGESETQKSIAAGLAKILELDTRLYHAVASKDAGSIYIISKQRASQVRDEKTRNKTPYGEKPKLAEYLVLMQCMVEPTAAHDLGVITRIMRSYCAACKAGMGMCYHRALLLWMQYHHWGEGRPTPRPVTSDLCSWIPGSRAARRTCSSVVPAGKLMIEQMPRSLAEAKAKLERNRQNNLKMGADARYDVFGGNEKKRKLLEDPAYTSAARTRRLFDSLKAAQLNTNAEDSDADGV